MKNVFPSEWRTQTRWKRRFYARYMRGLERAGYVLVIAVFAAFILAFNVKAEDVVSADKVAIVPFTQSLSTAGPTLVTRSFVADRDMVHRGQPLFEIVTGDSEIELYHEWEAVQALPVSPEKTTLLARTGKPRSAILVAPADGTFRLDAEAGTTLAEKGVLGRVVDYGDLRVEASLAGDTVAQARPNAVARIVNIAIEPTGGTLFRGGGAVSGTILGESLKTFLTKEMVGRGIRLRDDVPLRIDEIKEVQVDAEVSPTPGGMTGAAVDLDPPADLQVAAQVVEGKPTATVQVADLPADLAEPARQVALNALNGRVVRAANGAVKTLSSPRDLHMVVKLKAGAGAGTSEAIPGAMLSRTFDAKLRLVSPPKSLVDAVQAADAAGRAVTCRVELRTGERPIALRLLKKS